MLVLSVVVGVVLLLDADVVDVFLLLDVFLLVDVLVVDDVAIVIVVVMLLLPCGLRVPNPATFAETGARTTDLLSINYGSVFQGVPPSYFERLKPFMGKNKDRAAQSHCFTGQIAPWITPENIHENTLDIVIGVCLTSAPFV